MLLVRRKLQFSKLAPCLALLVAGPAQALEEVTVTATRVERDILDIPMSVSMVDSDDVQRRQLIGLNESMNRIPGVYITSPYNASRDLRMSIRGFGSRSAFGIRGLKVYIDGIPATAPDGQTALDDLDLASVERIEVIRGPASALYGSSAGGVVNIFTQSGTEIPFVEAGVSLGSYDFERYQFKTGGQAGALNYFVNGSYLDYDGYRDNAEAEKGNINGKFGYTFSDGSVGQLIVRYADAPWEQDPGGINAAQVARDPGSARDQNILQDAGEEVQDTKVAWSWQKSLDVHEFSLRNYYNWRDFYAQLPIGNRGITTFERFFYGGGAQYSNTSALFGRNSRATLGVDAAHMTDDRQRYANNGGQQGALQFDEDENADTVGIYLQEEFALNEHLDLQAGLRYDYVRLGIDDKFLANGDQSDTLKFNEVTWMTGVMWHLFPFLNPYVNYATAFETPTFTEFAQDFGNGGTEGFANVAAQRSRGFEAGFKGVFMDRMRYDFAYYNMTVEDEVVEANFNGAQAFFENADTDREGIEVSLDADVVEGLDLAVSYTYTDLKFDRFVTNPGAEGNYLPGVPRHFGYIELDYQHSSGAFVKWDWAYFGSVFANNANSTKVDNYDVSNLILGYDYRVDKITFSPTVGINNLFNEGYNADVLTNNFGGRFYDPAPERNIFASFRVRYDFDL